jgi:hypothetical protein
LPFWILIVPFLYAFVTGYGLVKGIDNFWRVPGVSNKTWSHRLHIVHVINCIILLLFELNIIFYFIL